MKLTKINYGSAVYFAVISLAMSLLSGLYLWQTRDVLIAQGFAVTWVQTFITAPLVSTVIGYLIVLVIIGVYNLVAKKYPIAWEIKK